MATKNEAIEWLMRPKTVNDLAEMMGQMHHADGRNEHVSFSIPNGPDLTEMIGVLNWLVDNKTD